MFFCLFAAQQIVHINPISRHYLVWCTCDRFQALPPVNQSIEKSVNLQYIYISQVKCFLCWLGEVLLVWVK